MTKNIVVGLGEVLWDVYDDQALFGGAPANFACHAANLGAEARIVSAVGRDKLGTDALAWMSKHHLSTEWVAVDDARPTGTVRVSLDSFGTPQYVFARNVAWDALPCPPSWLETAAICQAVCFGSLAQRSPLSCESIHRFLEHTQASCLRVFDVNLRQDYYSAGVLLRSLQRSNVLKLNHEELPIVADTLGLTEPRPGSHVSDPREERGWCQAIADRFELRCIALTRGPKGSDVWLDGDWDYQGSCKIDAVDTVGAGDAFSAALIMGILSKRDLPTIHSQAAKIAAYVCTQRGAVPRLPDELKYSRC